MIRAFFLDIRDGKMTRLPYFGYSILLDLLGLLFVFGIVVAMAGAETVMGGDLQEAQAVLRKVFTGPLLAALAVFFTVAVFASLNMSAKRIRDIGLPGWMVVFAIAVVTIAISILVSEKAAQSLSLVFWIALLLTPSNLLNKG